MDPRPIHPPSSSPGWHRSRLVARASRNDDSETIDGY